MLVSSTTSLTMKMSRREREVCFDFCWWGFWCSMLVESESKKKYRYPDSQYQSSLEKSSYICVVLSYCTTTWYFLSWTRSRAWRVSQRRSWKDLVLLTTSPQWTFFVTQTQDGLWNIVHSTFMFFHIPYDDVKEGTHTQARPDLRKREKILTKIFLWAETSNQVFPIVVNYIGKNKTTHIIPYRICIK